MTKTRLGDLCCHYQTGRSYIVSGEGKNRVYGYRNGVQCNLGDIERSEWVKMVKHAIQMAGEQELFTHLLDYLDEHNHSKEASKELEFQALQMHAARLFDNEEWVDFLEFNQKYRPNIIVSTMIVRVKPDCCKKVGTITKAMLDAHSKPDDLICCPHCGRWTHFKVISA